MQQDSFRCVKLFPEWNAAWLIHCQNLIYVDCLIHDARVVSGSCEKLDEMLSDKWDNDPLTEPERGFAINIRAQCHHYLGELDDAKRDYDEAIRLQPDEPRWYLNRARVLGFQGPPRARRGGSPYAETRERRGGRRSVNPSLGVDGFQH